MERTRFPIHLSKPFQILWFEVDELLIGVAFYFLSNIFSIWFLPFILIGPFYLKSIKSLHPRGFLKHIFYMIGFAKFKGYPIYFEKTFQE